MIGGALFAINTSLTSAPLFWGGMGLLGGAVVLGAELGWVLHTTVGFPAASGETFGRVGSTREGEAVRVLVLGDSVVDGTARKTVEDSLPGFVARELSEGLSKPVLWASRGRAGYTAPKLLKRLDQWSKEGVEHLGGRAPDVVVLSVGFNDAVRGYSTTEFSSNYAGLLDALEAKFPASAILSISGPPLEALAAVPFPLNRLIHWRTCRIYNAAAAVSHSRKNVTVAQFRDDISDLRPDEELFSSDNFHPGAAVLERMAKAVLEHLRILRPHL